MEDEVEAAAKRLCDAIRETAYAIHVYHGNGFLEKIYENALTHRLREAGHQVKQQQPVSVRDEDGTFLGEYIADLIIDDLVLVELKACKSLVNEHKAQLLHYLKSTGMEHGLLINFGSFKFEIVKLINTKTS